MVKVRRSSSSSTGGAVSVGASLLDAINCATGPGGKRREAGKLNLHNAVELWRARAVVAMNEGRREERRGIMGRTNRVHGRLGH